MSKSHSEYFFTVDEAASYLGVSKSTMYSYVKTGKIAAFKPFAGKSGKWKIPSKQLKELANVK